MNEHESENSSEIDQSAPHDAHDQSDREGTDDALPVGVHNPAEAYEVLDKVDDPEVRREVSQLLVAEMSRGPFPPPTFISGYEEVSKGLGVRVLESGIRRSDAITRQIEKDGESIRQVNERGQLIAAFIALVYFLGCMILILRGYERAGMLLGSILIVAIVVAFIGSSDIRDIAPSLFSRKPNQDQRDNDGEDDDRTTD